MKDPRFISIEDLDPVEDYDDFDPDFAEELLEQPKRRNLPQLYMAS